MASLAEMMQYADYLGKVNEPGVGAVNSAITGFASGLKEGKSKRALSDLGLSQSFDDINKEQLDAAYKFVEIKDKLAGLAQKSQAAQMFQQILQKQQAQVDQGQAQTHASLGTDPASTDKTDSGRLSSILQNYDVGFSGDSNGMKWNMKPHKPRSMTPYQSVTSATNMAKAEDALAEKLAIRDFVDKNPGTYSEGLLGNKPVVGQKEVEKFRPAARQLLQRKLKEYNASVGSTIDENYPYGDPSNGDNTDFGSFSQ